MTFVSLEHIFSRSSIPARCLRAEGLAVYHSLYSANHTRTNLTRPTTGARPQSWCSCSLSRRPRWTKLEHVSPEWKDNKLFKTYFSVTFLIKVANLDISVKLWPPGQIWLKV